MHILFIITAFLKTHCLEQAFTRTSDLASG